MKLKNESGRSMVEMLGVLAIIGVLSVGGIAGYTTAMRKHRVNEALNTANIMMIYCETHTCNNTAYSTAYPGASNPTGVTTMSGVSSNPAQVEVVMENAEDMKAFGEAIVNSGVFTSTSSSYGPPNSSTLTSITFRQK
ncbi:MAG: type II secretion system protein [Alphaproteobacteria bacterium]|nr:type II secretion system protein [Alphaproteobacteria bacterium]